MHPLRPHYLYQLASLLIAENRFLTLLENLQECFPWLRPCLGRMDSDSRQRLDCMRLFAAAHGVEEHAAGPVMEHLEPALQERGTTGRRAAALRTCTRQHRLLVNDYRIARELAHRLGSCGHVERIDAILSSMSDAFPAWHGPEALLDLASAGTVTAG